MPSFVRPGFDWPVCAKGLFLLGKKYTDRVLAIGGRYELGDRYGLRGRYELRKASLCIKLLKSYRVCGEKLYEFCSPTK